MSKDIVVAAESRHDHNTLPIQPSKDEANALLEHSVSTFAPQSVWKICRLSHKKHRRFAVLLYK